MRTFVIAILATALTAGWAAAGIPAGALSPIGNTATHKETVAYSPAGLLDCSGAIEIALDNTYTGDNTGLVGNVAGYSCGYWYEPGGEVVFHIFLAEPTMFTATVEGSSCDVDLAVLDQCDEDLGCVTLVDAGVTTDVPVSGDIYFVVDGWMEEGCPFTFTITEDPLPPAVTFCDLAEVVTGPSFSGEGYTCQGGENLISSLSCNSTPMDGLEAYYQITLQSGATLDAAVTNQADGALWVLGNCVEPFVCLAFADATSYGEPEIITYANTAASDLIVYLVVDEYGQGFCGDYEIALTITPGQVPVNPSSWGSIKSLFK